MKGVSAISDEEALGCFPEEARLNERTKTTKFVPHYSGPFRGFDFACERNTQLSYAR